MKSIAVSSSRCQTWQVEDLINYGFLPEFVGRFPVLAKLAALSQEQMARPTSHQNALSPLLPGAAASTLGAIPPVTPFTCAPLVACSLWRLP